MIARSLLVGVLLAVLTACASTPSLRKQILSGLEQKTRTIAIQIDETPPNRNFQVHESQAEKGAAAGAATGAFGSLDVGFRTADPMALFLGVVLMPVFAVGGAVVGAIAAEPIVHHYALDQVEGAHALFKATEERVNLRALLKDNLSKKTTTFDGHKIRFIGANGQPGQESAKRAEVQMMARIVTYSLVGELEDDPSVKLLLSGYTRVKADWARGGYTCKWFYRSSSRKLSEWSANGAERLVGEVQRAATKIADKILAALQERSGNCPEPEQRSWQELSYRETQALTQRADQNDTEAQYELALYFNRQERPGDEAKWVERLTKNARQGSVEAQHQLSRYYYHLDKVEDFVRWRCYAANRGHPDAQFSIGRSYQHGDETTERDPKLAYMWLALAEVSSDRSLRSVYREALAKSMSPDQVAEAE